MQTRAHYIYNRQETIRLCPRRLVATTADADDWVLDTFRGSRTMLAATEALGQRWVGIDNWDGGGDTTQRRVAHGAEVIIRHTPPIRAGST